MAQSLLSVHIHAVFSTIDRRPFLEDPEDRRKLRAYMAVISGKMGCDALAVGGVADHVHLLVRWGKTPSISDWMKEVKRVSSVSYKKKQPNFAWQSGYGVFAVEEGNLDRIAGYVRTQEDHHRSVSFQDELRTLCRDNRVDWDEDLLWK